MHCFRAAIKEGLPVNDNILPPEERQYLFGEFSELSRRYPGKTPEKINPDGTKVAVDKFISSLRSEDYNNIQSFWVPPEEAYKKCEEAYNKAGMEAQNLISEVKRILEAKQGLDKVLSHYPIKKILGDMLDDQNQLKLAEILDSKRAKAAESIAKMIEGAKIEREDLSKECPATIVRRRKTTANLSEDGIEAKRPAFARSLSINTSTHQK